MLYPSPPRLLLANQPDCVLAKPRPHDDTVAVVDFDACCIADPALDVGYFLAYLRPSGLWYQRPGLRTWFEIAAEEFTSSYTRASSSLGISTAEIDGILQRAQIYAAALLFKIATRRVNRLNSPRPAELASMLNEIAACLAYSGRSV
jgi:aminoglycoside phosphotransferase (APT) family kinase protein